MRIIVTGIAGLVGPTLTSKLLNQGHYVIGIDNFSHGLKENIEDLYKSPQFSFIESDLVTGECLFPLKADMIVHLASHKIPRYSNSYYTLRDNGAMIKHVLNKCLIDKIKLVFTSTSDIYGKNKELPFSEESDLIMGSTTVTRWAYAVSKMYSEHLIISAQAELGLDYTIARLFNVYGENYNYTWWNGPVGVFIRNILEGKKIQIHGTGEQTRCFTYVDDTTDGIIKCMFNDNALNQIINIGNPDTHISMIGLAQLIWELMDKKGEVPIEFVPYESFGKYEDAIDRIPDISKANELIGFNPSISLQKGLLKVIKWHTKLYKDDISRL
jgi:UDP-glucose 4-epimerase